MSDQSEFPFDPKDREVADRIRTDCVEVIRNAFHLSLLELNDKNFFVVYVDEIGQSFWILVVYATHTQADGARIVRYNPETEKFYIADWLSLKPGGTEV